MCKEEKKRQVELHLKPWLAPGTPYKRVWMSLGEDQSGGGGEEAIHPRRAVIDDTSSVGSFYKMEI